MADITNITEKDIAELLGPVDERYEYTDVSKVTRNFTIEEIAERVFELARDKLIKYTMNDRIVTLERKVKELKMEKLHHNSLKRKVIPKPAD